ncbi:two-component system sensor histidine kinase NtrB [Methylomonas sp. MS20]|uniref:two-component system sensor histidine kinase NtrB n=1 Tax=unclassified Methylomonas TaxID=2608980 RepID=UPI0028A3BECA|nr:PAS domain S-box protein [Methylomonas sp. MV1]MDT4331346.1 PAS domain S-box protein [Methylomonas sp. MV1]
MTKPSRIPTSLSFAILAAGLGLLFPLGTSAFLLNGEYFQLDLATLASLHRLHPELWVIWGAPLVLGLAGYLLGRQNETLQQKMRSLERQTSQLNTILDTAPSAIITIDQTGAIRSFNRGAERIFGYSAGQMVGENVKRLMPADIASRHDGYLAHYIATRESRAMNQRREFQGRRASGEIFAVQLHISPIEIDGETLFCGILDDVSETKALQTQLTQAQKLEAIGQLASGVAHEINTPIQYIGDNLAALQNYFADLSAWQSAVYQQADPASKTRLDDLGEQFDLAYILDDSPKAIGQALEGVTRVAEIVKAMKTFSHVEPSQSRQAINLNDTVAGAITISRNACKYIADVETDLAADLPAVPCYANELSQVLLNLIINAAHAIEEKGGERGVIQIATRKLGDMAEIRIRDNGAGIPAEIREKVFNLFFTTKPVGKGTGQGLSLAHNIIVERHRGRLYFESEAGLGTTFHVLLPLDPQAPVTEND